jgi:hypothetical protein
MGFSVSEAHQPHQFSLYLDSDVLCNSFQAIIYTVGRNAGKLPTE